ncbi:AMP-binding protein [Craterilacuibacter sinensis]|uniref:Long-chain-fatty-acid--CoA ligase n=1 Tax=Craterilacuibacter sinensis TaxID=2686017 RepID=A0A845BJE4_9NEIS|nr:AMP-binding protein [Craterilacuibacter sinensis]MXR36415.1 AMP-binding protein [Craterilacuibacter sinensis]RQW28475.1 long-chain-fatty-acid--CoA ligase [Rhodobacteraceae bacterium CH30]
MDSRHSHPNTALELNRFASLGDMLAASVKQYPARTAFCNMGAKLSYRELDRQSAAFAAYLTTELGLKQGDRVALMMPNLLQYPVALYGALRAGLVVVNVNPLYTPRELEHQLQDSGARAIVILENFAAVLQQVIANTPVEKVIVTAAGDLLGPVKGALVNMVLRHIKKMVPAWSLPDAIRFNAVLAQGLKLPWQDAKVQQSDIAFLQYTGGTTGPSKGAILTHGNLLANIEQVYSIVLPALGDARVVMATPLPLYHILALALNCLLVNRAGGTSVLMSNPRDLPAVIKDLARYPITCMTGVNTLYNALAHHPDFAKLDFSHWKVSVGGGATIQQAVAEKWQAVTGLPLIEGYGLTEASPMVCANPVLLGRYTGSIGLPIPGTEIALRDEEGRDVARGEPGELCVRGPQVMQGYWQRPDETAKVFHADGFLATGDIAQLTEQGFYKLVDRKKDMILVSGFNVYPNEIEDVIALHPDVQEVACIGVPDERTGEAVKIFVVKRHPGLTEEALIKHCRTHLTAYKVPRQVVFRTELPKTNIGKILRRELREEAPAMATANA